jgi:hypothetical protein
MVKKKNIEPPSQDLPAWFMTYSDVITLLMTFFILLLTFATNEPERFEKMQLSVFGQSGAPGIVGPKVNGVEFDSWAERVRPRAARVAMNGSEMPPIVSAQDMRSVGEGLSAPSDEASKFETMSCHEFVVKLDSIVNSNGELTTRGMQMLDLLARQLQRLSVNCTIQFSNMEYAHRVTQILMHLYHVEMVRPGQVGIGYRNDVTSGTIRIVIENFQ